jgi:5-methylcytosine-specific restriction endonuclease McrA
MVAKSGSTVTSKQQDIIGEVRKNRERRENTYRERALKLFPHICAHCGREFSGKKLRELTVHHKDHDHNNNPPDGSNWELLCIYCHDNEHSRLEVAEAYGDKKTSSNTKSESSSGFNTPFANLAEMLNKKK